jgi:hypothetical protein
VSPWLRHGGFAARHSLKVIQLFAIKCYYKDGHIELTESIPEAISSAELNIVVMPEQISNSEAEFQAIGLNSFFKTKDDAEIDWEKFFGLEQCLWPNPEYLTMIFMNNPPKCRFFGKPLKKLLLTLELIQLPIRV